MSLMMLAIVIPRFGGPEVLELREVPDPEIPEHHLLIKVHYTAVNRADLLQRAGRYPAPAGVPADIPGLEYMGTVEAVGHNGDPIRIGERVFGLVGGGAYAEKIVIHEQEAIRVPDTLTDEQGAAVPEAFLTAWDALQQAGVNGNAKSNVLIHAVGSGVGTAALQLCKVLGSFTIGTSRGEAKLHRCYELGLDKGIVVDESQSFAGEVLRLTSGNGVDAVVDLVGGAYVAEGLHACAKQARIVVIGLTAGVQTAIDLGLLLRKRLTLIGTVLRSRSLEEKIGVARWLANPLSGWFEQGCIHPVVDRVYPFAEAAEAHRYVASNASFGKVLLRVL